MMLRKATGCAARLCLALLTAAAGISAPVAALAQSEGGVADAFEVDRQLPVALEADEISFDDAAKTVTARGNVIVYYGERTLEADEIVYDSVTERIAATGAVTVRAPNGDAISADFADLDADLRDGLIRGARSVLAGGAKLAAVEGQRIDGRYNALSRAVYSACEVCAEEPTPLWRIRARRIVHDETARDIHFEDATLDVLGVPVAYLPYFRVPDPTVKRRTGFLAPRVLQDGNFGYAAKIPYFIVLDETSDVTLAPFVTEMDGALLEAEYRKWFERGYVEFDGSLGYSDFDGEDRLRGHIFGGGLFDAGDGYVAGLRLEMSSDDDYLRRFDLSDEDRLESELFLEKYEEQGFFSVSAVRFQSLRVGEFAGQIPLVAPEIGLRREFDDPLFGGAFGLEGSSVLLTRDQGRDVLRLSAAADWERTVALPVGILMRGFASARADLYGVYDDPGRTDESATRFAPLAGVEARYPLIRRGDGVDHMLEPVAQLIAAPSGLNPDDIPNEDSPLVDFDENDLFDENRFAGFDRFEGGSRINLGLRYERISADGVTLSAAGGRVFRFSEESPFAAGSGLSERRSDYVAAWSFGVAPYFNVTNRLRMDGDFDLSRNDVRAAGVWGPVGASTSYLFLSSDGAETTGTIDRHEVAFDSYLDVTGDVRLTAGLTRDLEIDEMTELRAGVSYSNECAAVDLTAKRSFTGTDNAPASTSFGVQVRLFGATDTSKLAGGPCRYGVAN